MSGKKEKTLQTGECRGLIKFFISGVSANIIKNPIRRQGLKKVDTNYDLETV